MAHGPIGYGWHFFSRSAPMRISILFILLLLTSSQLVSAQEITVTLLGTGSPLPVMDRFGPSTLVQAGDQVLIFDAGRGAHQRLSQVGLTERNVDAIFLTHLHSDHIVGLPDLWLTGWVTTRRDRPLKLFGPPGIARMMDHLRQAFEVDIRVRTEESNTPPAGAEVQATDIQEGVIYDKNG